MRVPCEAKLSRDDRPLLYRGLAISKTCSHAKNRNDPVPITWSKVAFPEVGFSAVAILGGGWLQSPASDGPPCYWHMQTSLSVNELIVYIPHWRRAPSISKRSVGEVYSCICAGPALKVLPFVLVTSYFISKWTDMKCTNETTAWIMYTSNVPVILWVLFYLPWHFLSHTLWWNRPW